MSTRHGNRTSGSSQPSRRAEAGLLEAHRLRLIADAAAGRRVLGVTMPRPETELRAALPGLARAAEGDAVVVLIADGGAEALRAEAERLFQFVRAYVQRPVNGSLVLDARFSAARVAPLRDAAAAGPDACALLLCSRAALPPVAGGIFETAQPREPADAANGVVTAALRIAPPRPYRREQTAGVVNRLMELSRAHREAERELDRMRAHDAGRRTAATSDITDARHPWPLLDRPDRDPATLTPHERRFDDDLISGARAAAAFRHEYALDSDAPQFAAAAAALNGMPRVLSLVAEADAVAPDASIVIPVHGQLAYTLGCLRALFAQASAYAAEIVVVDDASPDATAEILPLVRGVRVIRNAVNAGFLVSANTGAAQARGRVIVFLNNDAWVLPGWLDGLMDSFDIFPRAGLVGSKLLYPDGTLQEAGGIVFNRGEGWNFGRGDDPNRPRYCHARRVDYVSGASVAIPADLWRTLGGFDVLFAPAYYEDTDLAFRVRAAGYETWYQPVSRVIHYEGKTSGTDLGGGAKAYQARNAGRFRLRYRDTLATHGFSGQQVLLARERDVRRRALVIEASFPTPKEDAGSGYTVAVMQLLQDLGYKVTFIAADNFLFHPEHIVALQKRGIECGYFPYDVRAGSYLAQYGALYDIVCVFRIGVLEEVLDAVRRHAPDAPLIFDNHDLHFLRMQRGAAIAGDADAHAAAERMRTRELAAMAKVDSIVTLSSFERTLLAGELPEVPGFVVPIMVEPQGTRRGFAVRKDVCFLGGYTHPPNVDAARHFASDILPRLRAQQKSIGFVIAGANPTPDIRALESRSVRVTGMVPDLRDVFDPARVFVCPLRYGAGMKGKIVTAMAYGIPVVTTSIGIEGIDARDGEDVLIANDAESFAAAVMRLYTDARLWRKLSGNGLRLVSERYSLAHGRESLRQAIEAAYARRLADLSVAPHGQAEIAQ